MSAQDGRRSTPLPGTPNSEDFRVATEAMKRAAEAMIAATESFRTQFHHKELAAANHESNGMIPQDNGMNNRHLPSEASDHRPASDEPYHSTQAYQPSMPASDAALAQSGSISPTRMGCMPSSRLVSPPLGEERDSSPIAKPKATQTAVSYTPKGSPSSPPSIPAPSHTPFSQFFPKQLQTSYDNVNNTYATVTHHNEEDSRPDLAPTVALETMQRRPLRSHFIESDMPLATHQILHDTALPDVQASIGRSATEPLQPSTPMPAAPPSTMAHSTESVLRSARAHVDLVEAASRLKEMHSYQGVGHAGQAVSPDAMMTPATSGGGGGSDREPDPVLKIGRYTYVRSDSDDFQSSLSSNDGVQRYTTMPVSQSRNHRYQKHTKGSSSNSHSRPHGFSRLQEALFVLVICLSQVLMLSGMAQALVPGRILGQSFPGTRPGDIAWYTAAYGLTSGTFVLPAGRLGDIFGHRRIFIAGFLWFALWSLLAGFAQLVQGSGGGGSPARGTVYFVVSRAMQGIGPAMLVPNGQAMLGRSYQPGQRKNMVMCLFGAAAPLGFVTGAAMSSLFAQKASWPWAFWTMAAVCISLAAVSTLVLPADSPPVTAQANDTYEDDDVVAQKNDEKSKSGSESLFIRMDAAGMLLGVSSLALVNFAFNQAPIVGWSTPYVYFLLIIGLLLFAAFAYVEITLAPHPLVPFATMKSTTNFVLSCTAAGWSCFSVWLYYSVSFLENLRGWSPLLTSAAYAPAPFTGLAASLLTGCMFTRGVKPHWVMLASMCAFFTGSVLYATAPVNQLYWLNSFFSILIMPFGMDMSNPAAIILLSNSVGHANQGIAASLVVTIVNYSISLSLGIAGSVEASNFNKDNLLVGYRAAQYFGLGLGGLGILLATAFLCRSFFHRSQDVMAAENTGP